MTNTLTIRIQQPTTLVNFQALFACGGYSSKNALANKIFEIGVDALMNPKDENFQVQVQPQNVNNSAKAFSDELQKITNQLKQFNASFDDLFVKQSINEWLLSSLFNAELFRKLRKDFSADMFEQGNMSELPTILQHINNDILQRFDNRK